MTPVALVTPLVALALLGAQAAPGRDLLPAAPMAGRATHRSVELTVLTGEQPVRLSLRLARDGGGEPQRPVAFGALQPSSTPVPRLRARGSPSVPERADEPLLAPARALVELVIDGLEPGSAWRWQLAAAEGDAGERTGAALRRSLHAGRFVTARPRGAAFRFAVFSDSHIFPAPLEPPLVPEVAADERILGYVLESVGWYRTTRERIALECAAVLARVSAEAPDFAVSLGDVFDLHGRGFNWAFDSQALADSAHLEARNALGALADAGAIYQVVGNWEGESGCHAPEQRAFAIRARERHAANPRPDTSPLGGSPDEDYFAWEWGDALCVALNVRGYTPTSHHLGNDGVSEGRPEDFTLGPAQREYLERTLAGSDHPWKLLFVHHVVGGNGGNPDDSAYGRGGGRAARVGEQAWVHDLCLKHGVQVIFYGHDHVFTDQVVDGVHYTLAGTTSAPWRFKTEETGYEQYWPDSGFARVSVEPRRLLVEFVALEGRVLHSFEVSARAP